VFITPTTKVATKTKTAATEITPGDNSTEKH